MEADQKTIRNQILAKLAPRDFALLKPHLDLVGLPARKLLEARNRRTDAVFFVESGIASVVVSADSLHTVEVGIVGREGMTGWAAVMSADRSPHEVFMQTAGTGWRMGATELASAMDTSATLRRQILRRAHAFMIQVSYTALANARYTIEERLARWLLMAQDRVGGSDIAMTHEFLSTMLGVRRPGVTAALNGFENNGLIRARRGEIVILNRIALEDTANGCYGVPETEAERTFGTA